MSFLIFSLRGLFLFFPFADSPRKRRDAAFRHLPVLSKKCHSNLKHRTECRYRETSRNLQAQEHARPDRTAFPPESGCKDTHSRGTGKQNRGLFSKKIRGDRQNRCRTGQYTGKIIRAKEGREGNGHIYYIIYTHGRRKGTGAEGQKKFHVVTLKIKSSI